MPTNDIGGKTNEEQNSKETDGDPADRGSMCGNDHGSVCGAIGREACSTGRSADGTASQRRADEGAATPGRADEGTAAAGRAAGRGRGRRETGTP